MRTMARMVMAALLGAMIGGAWAATYSPPVSPVVPVILAHLALALVLERGLALVRLRAPVSLVFAIITGLTVVPVWLRPFQEVGLLRGRSVPP